MIQPLAFNPFVTSAMPKAPTGVTPPVLMAYDTHVTVMPNFGYSMHAIGDELPIGSFSNNAPSKSTFQRLNVLA